MRLRSNSVFFALLASGLLAGSLAAAQSEAVKSAVEDKETPTAPTKDEKPAEPTKSDVVPEPARPIVAPPPVTFVKKAPVPMVKTVTDSRPPRPMMAPAPKAPRRNRYSKYNMLVSDDGLTLHAVGTFQSGFTREFKRALEENKNVKTVTLSSDGGTVIEGIAVSKLIEKHGLDTHVEVVCASACTFAFLKGNRKTISQSGRLGFHQAHKGIFSNPSGSATRNAASWAMANAYSEAGLDKDTIDKALSTAPKNLWFPENAFLVKSLKRARIVDNGVTKFDSGSWKSVLTMRKLLSADPVWQNMEKTKSADYLQAISKIWVDSIIANDEDKVVESVQDGLINMLFTDLAKYPDDIVESALQLQTDIWKLKDDKRNNRCTSLGRRRVPVLTPVIFAHKERRDLLLKKMIAHDIADNPLSDEERNRSYALAIDFWGLMLSETKSTVYGVSREFCNKPKQYFEQLSKLPSDKRTATFRALMTEEARIKPLTNMY